MGQFVYRQGDNPGFYEYNPSTKQTSSTPYYGEFVQGDMYVDEGGGNARAMTISPRGANATLSAPTFTADTPTSQRVQPQYGVSSTPNTSTTQSQTGTAPTYSPNTTGGITINPNGSISETPKYNVTGPTPQLVNAVTDPYTRGLLAAGLQAGDTTALISESGRQAEQARREAALRNTVLPVAQAELNLGLTAVEKQMQRAGKLSSSATIEQMMRTSELYSAQVAAAMSEGSLEIAQQIGAERDAELNRIYQSGIASLQAETQTNVANLEAQMQDRIAKINADTILTGYDKQLQIAALEDKRDRDIAKLNADTSYSIAQLNATTQKELQVGEFSFRTENGIKDWVSAQTLQEKTTINPATGKSYAQENFEKQFSLEYASTINPDTGLPWSAEEMKANLQIAYKELDIKQDYNEWSKGIAQQTLTEQARQFDLTNTREFDQWTQSFAETTRQFNLSQEESVRQFNEQLKIARDAMTNNEDRQFMTDMVAVLSDPAIQSYFSTSNPKALANGVEIVMNYFASGGELSDTALVDLQTVLSNPHNKALTFEEFKIKHSDWPGFKQVKEYAKYARSYQSGATSTTGDRRK